MNKLKMEYTFEETQELKQIKFNCTEPNAFIELQKIIEGAINKRYTVWENLCAMYKAMDEAERSNFVSDFYNIIINDFEVQQEEMYIVHDTVTDDYIIELDGNYCWSPQREKAVEKGLNQWLKISDIYGDMLEKVKI